MHSQKITKLKLNKVSSRMQENLKICRKFLNENNILFEENFDLKKKSWLKAGGKF